MITKSNTNPIPRCFLNHDNLIKGKIKPIIKLNSQLNQYLRMNVTSNDELSPLLLEQLVFSLLLLIDLEGLKL